MVKTEIVINRSANVVWDFYVKKENWPKWHGSFLESVTPGWVPGATLKWGDGSSNTIGNIIPQKEVQIDGRFVTVINRFKPLNAESTLVEQEALPKGGARLFFRWWVSS